MIIFANLCRIFLFEIIPKINLIVSIKILVLDNVKWYNKSNFRKGMN